MQLMSLALAAPLASAFTPLRSSPSSVGAKTTLSSGGGSGSPLMIPIKMVATNAEAEAVAVAGIEADLVQKRKRSKEVSCYGTSTSD